MSTLTTSVQYILEVVASAMKQEKELKEYSLKLHENYKPSDPIVQKQLNKVKAQKIKENYTRAHSI